VGEGSVDVVSEDGDVHAQIIGTPRAGVTDEMRRE
jgi:hypothetical protein